MGDSGPPELSPQGFATAYTAEHRSVVCGECKLFRERVASCGKTLGGWGRGTTIHGLNRYLFLEEWS